MKLQKHLFTGTSRNIGRFGFVEQNSVIFLTDDEAVSVANDPNYTNVQGVFTGGFGLTPNGQVVGKQGDQLYDDYCHQIWVFHGPNGNNGWRLMNAPTSTT